MRKHFMMAGVAMLSLLPLGAHAQGARFEVLQALREIEGRPTWLRVDVVRVQYPLRGEDATYIYPDGHVRYSLQMGFRATESTSSEEFTKDIQRSLQQSDSLGQVRVVGKGSPVTITKTKAEKEEVELEVRDSGGSKHKIRLKFKGAGYGYSAEDVKRLVAVGFANTEAEAKSTSATVNIELGMTVEKVIAIKGSPKTRVDLGKKVILTYDDLKLVFEGGKLVDVQ